MKTQYNRLCVEPMPSKVRAPNIYWVCVTFAHQTFVAYYVLSSSVHIACKVFSFSFCLEGCLRRISLYVAVYCLERFYAIETGILQSNYQERVRDFGFSKQEGLRNQVFISVNKSLHRIKVAELALADLSALRTELSEGAIRSSTTSLAEAEK